MSEKLKVVIFSGGRGAATISKALARHPRIDLSVLVNAYDDGLSTGRLRRFIPGMLGPSDIRKNMVHLLLSEDRSDRTLRTLLEHRLPDPTSHADGIRVLEVITSRGEAPFPFAALDALFNDLSVGQARETGRFAGRFLEYARKRAAAGEPFDFSDCAVGNLLFSGCYLVHREDFNQAVRRFGEFCGVTSLVLNITRGENLVLLGVKEDGTLLKDEASIVARQNATQVSEIFLLERYLNEAELDELEGLAPEKKIAWLRKQSKTPGINPEAAESLRSAHLIIYGPGTQHSSLFPSYLTEGVGDTIAANQGAEKIFIANIRKDYEIQSETTNTLVRKVLYYLNRKGTQRLGQDNLVTHFFFEKPDELVSAKADYIAYAPDEAVPSDKVVGLDWEAGAGVHLGGKVVDEILAIVNAQTQRQLKASPYMVSIVVPALNEAKTIPKVLHDLVLMNFYPLQLDKEIIFVDGGSSDGSFELAKAEPSVRAYRLEGCPGRGAALRCGIEKAQGNIIAFFPSDGEYRPEDFVPLVKAVAQEEYPAAFGSRATKCVDLSERVRRIYQGNVLGYLVGKYGGILLSVVSLLLYNRFVTDPLTSVKAFDTRLLRDLRLRSNGVDLETEIIAKLARRRTFILEVPVEFHPRRKDEGKKTTVLDGLKALAALFRYRIFS